MKSNLNFKQFKKDLLKDPQIRKEYESLEPEFVFIRELLRIRKERSLTQKDLAKKIGTTQSVISRFERGRANPTLSFLKRLASALSAKLEISLLR